MPGGAQAQDADDVDPIDQPKEEEDLSDLVSLSGGFISNINFKLFIFVFIVGLLIFSDIFIEGVLSKIDGATVDSSTTTTSGTGMQLLLLCLAMIVLDVLIKYRII